MVKANIGLDENVISEVSKILQKVLSDEYVLYTKTRNFHWNVTGPHFNDLHKFFEEHYEELDEEIDEIAERIRQLGVFPKASLKEFEETASLKESTKVPTSNEMVKELLNDHETMIKNIRNNVEELSELGDVGNEDFLIALMQKHEKMAWMLRSMQ